MTNQRLEIELFIGCEITKQQLYTLVYSFVQSLGPDPQLGQLGRGLCGCEIALAVQRLKKEKMLNGLEIKLQQLGIFLFCTILGSRSTTGTIGKGALWLTRC